MNGVLLGYRLNYTIRSRYLHSRVKKDVNSNPEQKLHSVTVGKNISNYVIENLKAFTTYSITIAGYNEHGVGPYSEYVDILTAEDGKLQRR